MKSIIAGIADNGTVGYENKLPWAGKVPKDLPHFKQQTKGHVLIMGRLTAESLNFKPLPGRTNIIVSTTLEPKEGFITVSTLREAIVVAEKENSQICFIGGKRIWKEAIELGVVERIIITRIHDRFHGDTFFPIDVLLNQYKIIYSTEWPETEPNISSTLELWVKK